MKIKVVEKHKEYGVDVLKIINRILKYVPDKSIEGLKSVVVLDNGAKAFSSYNINEKTITLYIDNIIGYLPFILRRTIILPYFLIAMDLGCGIDFHHNRDKNWSLKERKMHAEKYGITHVYSSFSIFKPVFKTILKSRLKPKTSVKEIV